MCGDCMDRSASAEQRQWPRRSTASGKTFDTINPATEEVLASVAHGEAEDADRAVAAARAAAAG